MIFAAITKTVKVPYQLRVFEKRETRGSVTRFLNFFTLFILFKMALINSHAIGKASGSLGNLTFRTDKAGRTIASGKIVHMTNPQTDAQTLNRQKQTIASLFFSAILQILNSGWKRAKPHVAPYSEAVGLARLIATWASPTPSDFAMQLVKVQSGALEQLENFKVNSFVYTSSTKILNVTAEWDDRTLGNGKPNDTLKLVIVNLSQNRVEGVSPEVTRTNHALDVDFANVNANDVYVVFPVLKSSNSLLVADSYLLGNVDAGVAHLN